MSKSNLPVYGRQISLPYNENLSDEEFEVLLYSIFNKHIEIGAIPFIKIYDTAHLMPGVGEEGRDVLLTKKNKNVGLIQCKKVKKSLSKSLCAEEIIKFSLNAICNPKLISNKREFTYYLAASTGFSKPSIELISTFNASIMLEPDLEKWIRSVMKKYKAFKDLKYDDVQGELKDILTNINVIKIIPADLNRWLNNQSYYQIVKSCFPEVNLVIITNEEESQIFYQNQQALNQAELLWENLQAQQANTLITTIEKAIENSGLSTVNHNLLYAKICYLKAYVQADLGDLSQFDTLSIKAYSYNKNIRKYRERAARAYFDKGEVDKAYEIAQLLIDEDENNYRAWTVMGQIYPERAIPSLVRDSPDYKVGQIGFLRSDDGKISVSDIRHIFTQELEKLPVPNDLKRTNIFYWTFVAQVVMQDVFKQGTPIDIEKFNGLVDNPQLRYARDLFAQIVNRVHNTDFQERDTFRIARFNYYFCQYFLINDSIQEKEIAQEIYSSFIGSLRYNLIHLGPRIPSLLETIPHTVIEVFAILLQQKLNKEVISATSYLQDPIPLDVYLLLGIAYNREGRKDEMIDVYNKYIKELYKIDQHIAGHCFDVIRSLQYAQQDSDKLILNLTTNKEFENSFIKELLEAFCWSIISNKKSVAKEYADRVRKHWVELENPLMRALAVVYTELQEWTTAAELWHEIVGDSKDESDNLRVYLITLFEGRLNLVYLTEMLAYWRENHTPDLDLTTREIALYRKLRNYLKMAEIGSYGIRNFPNNPIFWVDSIRAMHRLDETEALLQILDERIFKFNIHPEVKLSVAHIYLVRGRKDIGLEVCYRVVKENWLNPKIKNYYFSLSTQYKVLADIPSPETVQVGMVVRIQKDNTKDLVELTSELLEQDKFYRNIIGLHVNDSFTFKNTVTDIDTVYTIDAIFDKYQGLSALIIEEVFNKPLNGMNAQTFQFSSEKEPSEMLKDVQKVLGPQGTKYQLIVEEIRRKFSNSEIGFIELTQQGFRGNPIIAWQYITSDHGGGFPITPLALLQKIDLNSLINLETEYVLDFSSLLTIFGISENYSLSFVDKKFILSQYIFDYVSVELEQADNEIRSDLSISATVDRIVTNFHPDYVHERQLIFWRSLNSWIKKNCVADYAWERISWVNERGEENVDSLFPEDNMIMSAFSDTLLLLNRPNRVLITDDLLFQRLGKHSLKWITVEWFLRKTRSAMYRNFLWIELLRLNMRGLTLTGEQLHKIFTNNQIISDASSDYIKATHSFSPYYNPNIQNWPSVIRFLKLMYADNFALDYKRRISMNLFKILLTGGGRLSGEIVEQVLQIINEEFELLGDYSDKVKQDLINAIAMLRMNT